MARSGCWRGQGQIIGDDLTKKTLGIVGTEMAQGMLNAVRGLVPDNVVNADVLERPGFRAKLARFHENMS
jgi:hypothetical protein